MLKMTGNLPRIFQKLSLNICNRNIAKKCYFQVNAPIITCERTLFSKASLGLDAFDEQRERIKQQLSYLEDKFKARMKEYTDDSKNMIFTEDLKNMVHLANSEDDAKLVVEMIKRFNKQNEQLRFGSFKFGPVVMRLFHKLNKPLLAIECFQNDKEFNGFFDQLTTYQIYLDLLFENKMYQEVLDNFDIIQNRQIEGAMYPRNSMVLVIAACYKLNNAESLDYAFKLWKKLGESGYYPTRRTITFCAALALNQGQPEAALEIVSTAKNPNYTTVRNLKLLIFAELGRLEDVMSLLKSIFQNDSSENTIHTFNRDVLDKIKTYILKADNPELSVEYNRLEQLLEKQGHISEKLLDEQLCSDIQKPPPSGNQQFGRYNNYQQKQNYNNRSQRPRPRSRPGLEELL